MAAWQFDLYIIPRGALRLHSDTEVSGTLTLPLTIVHNVQNELAAYLGPPWLMLSDWLVFGPENGNRIDVIFESEDAGSVFVRCDLREEAPQFLVLTCKIAQSNDCLFFSPQSRRLIEPTLEALSGAIAIS